MDESLGALASSWAAPFIPSTLGTEVWPRGYRRSDSGAGLLGRYFFFLSTVFRESATVDDVGAYGPGLWAWQRRPGGWDVTKRRIHPLAMLLCNLPLMVGCLVTSLGIHVTRPIGGADFWDVGPFPFLAGMLC